MSWELECYDWSRLEADGGASGVPSAIKALESATTNEVALAAYWKIDNTVVVQGAVYPAALPTVRCLLVSLLRSTAIARPHILELLVQIGAGEAAIVEASNSDIVQRCLVEIARGLPIYMDILERSVNSDERAFCVDLIGLCCRVDPSLRERVGWYFNKVKSSHPSNGLLRLISSWEEEVGTPGG
ncbi:MAG: hypothetical protein IPM54_15840 [Polyangiaceae bacterium]|nr:hypothetical protein [Polyangiaceae bacterium]